MTASRTESQRLATIEEKFRAFHEAHPDIHRQLLTVARRLARERYSRAVRKQGGRK